MLTAKIPKILLFFVVKKIVSTAVALILSIIGTQLEAKKKFSSALCCVQEIGEPYALDHNEA